MIPQRYFIKLAYNGANYCGWQIQPNGIAVQQRLQEALSTLMRQPIEVVGAGRTDAGVHATGMVAHFEAPQPITDITKLLRNLNSYLPNDIALYDMYPLTPDAHARFDATARTYEYWVVRHKSPFYQHTACRMTQPLDFELMNQAAALLFNYTDFTSFSKLHTDVKTNLCTIMFAQWEQRNDVWVFTIQANRFLRNMVRAIVGTLFEVGLHRITLEEFCQSIEAKDRGRAEHSVPAHALYLTKVDYPESILLIMATQ